MDLNRKLHHIAMKSKTKATNKRFLLKILVYILFIFEFSSPEFPYKHFNLYCSPFELGLPVIAVKERREPGLAPYLWRTDWVTRNKY